MTHVEVSRAAREDLARLHFTHKLPADTGRRLQRSIEHLAFAPLAGRALDGAWGGYRYILGPWPWLVVVYRYNEQLDRLIVSAIRDGRSSRAPRPQS